MSTSYLTEMIKTDNYEPNDSIDKSSMVEVAENVIVEFTGNTKHVTDTITLQFTETEGNQITKQLTLEKETEIDDDDDDNENNQDGDNNQDYEDDDNQDNNINDEYDDDYDYDDMKNILTKILNTYDYVCDDLYISNDIEQVFDMFRNDNVIENCDDPKLLCYIGLYYFSHNEIKNMLKCYHRSADQHNICALYNLGYYYGTQEKYEIMETYYLRAITEGECLMSMYNIAEYYKSINNTENMIIYHSLAAEKGGYESAYELGSYYEEHDNTELMLKYYKIAADDNIDACITLGKYYRNNDKELMAQYYIKQIELNNYNNYNNDNNNDNNDDNNDNDIVDIMNELGDYYREIKDDENMLKYYLMAIHNNDFHSIKYVGDYYKNNNDNMNMLKYYLLVNDNKDNLKDTYVNEIMHEIGIHYMNQKDYLKAEQYLSQLSDKNISDKMYGKLINDISLSLINKIDIILEIINRKPFNTGSDDNIKYFLDTLYDNILNNPNISVNEKIDLLLNGINKNISSNILSRNKLVEHVKELENNNQYLLCDNKQLNLCIRQISTKLINNNLMIKVMVIGCTLVYIAKNIYY